jgi:hypothetical protein
MKGYLHWLSIVGLFVSLVGLVVSGNSVDGFAQAQSATSPSTQEVESATASLTVIEGQVFVRRAGSEDWQPVAEAVTVAAGDTVKTGADGRAILTFFEGSESVLDPGTEMTVQTLKISGNQPFDIKLRLWLGSTWHSVQKFYGSESRYEVDTPSATLVARGTKWWVSVDDQGRTRAKIIEGKVDIQGQWTEGFPPDKALYDEIVTAQESKEASPKVGLGVVAQAFFIAQALQKDLSPEEMASLAQQLGCQSGVCTMDDLIQAKVQKTMSWGDIKKLTGHPGANDGNLGMIKSGKVDVTGSPGPPPNNGNGNGGGHGKGGGGKGKGKH